jgi:enterochelin esterase-like enzyme
MRIAIILSLLLLGSCGAPKRLLYTEVESDAVGRTLGLGVWAPIDLQPEERLPLVVFLHGGMDDDTCFDDAQVGQYLDHALAAGEIPRAVIVVPDGQLGFWENWYDGSLNYRDWVIDEVMPKVEAQFHTLPCPDGCHVAGVSMGGHGALRFALFRPDRFSTVASLSGFIMSSDDVARFADAWYSRHFIPIDRIWGPVSDLERVENEDLFLRWTTQKDLHGLRLMVAWAEGDRQQIVDSNQAFETHLVERKIEHDLLIFSGGHDWKSWTPAIKQVLRFAIWGSIDSQAPGSAG